MLFYFFASFLNHFCPFYPKTLRKTCIFHFFVVPLHQILKGFSMSKYEIPFLTSAIQAFANKFAMTRQAAFRYLQQYKALAFLVEFYDVEHLQSMDDTIDDMLIICRQNGGTLV